MDKKIVLFTTFRPFDGTTNDKIQRLFLENVKKQTYQNYILAVTIFAEKGVPETLTEFGIPHILYYEAPDPSIKKFSLTRVLLNGIEAAKEYPEGCMLLWANSDTMLDPDFFERTIKSYGSKIGGISYPQMQYQSMADYQAKRNSRCAWYGFDAAFFSSDVFDEKCVAAIKKYPNSDAGYFEMFVAALATVFCDTRINLWPAAFSTIANDYVAIHQTPESTKESAVKNMIRLKEFMREFNIPDKGRYHLFLNYTLTENSSLSAWFMRIRIYLHIRYADSYIRRILPKLKRMSGLS